MNGTDQVVKSPFADTNIKNHDEIRFAQPSGPWQHITSAIRTHIQKRIWWIHSKFATMSSSVIFPLFHKIYFFFFAFLALSRCSRTISASIRFVRNERRLRGDSFDWHNSATFSALLRCSRCYVVLCFSPIIRIRMLTGAGKRITENETH